MNAINIQLPISQDTINSLVAGQKVYLTGTFITARDSAHKRIIDLISQNKPLLFEIKNQGIYYCGPTPAKIGFPIGACGPTTSGRMDSYVKTLFENGLKFMIGKGKRNQEVKDTIMKHKGIYFIATGGAGALYAKCVKKCTCIAWEDLGAEAVYSLEVETFPLYVGLDIYGNDIYNLS
jgi:fumarate hydratase subunit beta